MPVATADRMGFTPAGTGAAQRSVRSKLRESVFAEDFGVVGDGTTDDKAALQAAINAASTLWLKPFTTYLISDYLTLKPNLRIVGQGATLLLGGAATGMLYYSGANLTDLTVEDLHFDGTSQWPSDETAYKNDFTTIYGIQVISENLRRLAIRRCRFTKMVGGSINIQAVGGRGVLIEHCDLDRGFYKSKGVSVYADNGSSDASRCRNICINNVSVSYGGPTAFADAAVENYLNSSDGVHIDGCADIWVNDCTINNVAGIGIRIEQTVNGSVTNNKVHESGGDGILIYAGSENIAISNNEVTAWGRLPFAYSAFDYSGTLVIPRESPADTLAPFPTDPTASAWWEEWPYTTTGIGLGTITDYADRAYYSGLSTGALAFRGHCGIGVVQSSKTATVTGNVCIPDLTTDEGKYTHASDYGLSIAHFVNKPYDEASLPIGIASGNIFGGRIAGIYTPEYLDPINERGALGTLISGTNVTL